MTTISQCAARLMGLAASFAPLLLFLSCTTASGRGEAIVVPEVRTIAIVGATVIDGTGEAATDSGVVVISGDRIQAVGSAHDVLVPAGAEVIDAAGRFLLPGFIDAHAHVALGPVTIGGTEAGPTMSMALDPEVARRSLRSLLAHGITTIRDPGGPAEVLVDLRAGVERG